MTKYIFISGGVISGIGKGVSAASIGFILKSYGYKITMIKADPYLNVDAGTMNPLEHGETFLLKMVSKLIWIAVRMKDIPVNILPVKIQ